MENQQITILLEDLIKLVNKYPNNYELGDEIRKLIAKLEQENKHGS